LSTRTKSSTFVVQATQASSDELLRRARGEYDEMPGLALTMPQARRLWALDQQTCEFVLRTLVERQFLKTTARGRYVRTEQARPVHRRATVDIGERKGRVVYLSAAHQVGSARALELAYQLSSWHDQMVMHVRAVARDGAAARCHDACPHVQAIELWRAARETLGDAARHFTFLKASATEARAVEDVVEPVRSEVPAASRR
jgi:hypothetical protein